MDLALSVSADATDSTDAADATDAIEAAADTDASDIDATDAADHNDTSETDALEADARTDDDTDAIKADWDNSDIFEADAADSSETDAASLVVDGEGTVLVIVTTDLVVVIDELDDIAEVDNVNENWLIHAERVRCESEYATELTSIQALADVKVAGSVNGN